MDENNKTTIEITNEKLEEAIQTYIDVRTSENLGSVLNLLRPTKLYVPAMLKAPNQPLPCFLKNNEGEQYLAVYTNKAQIPSEPKAQALLNMPFPACNSLVLKPELNLLGMVLNPFSHNLVLKKELIEKLHEADVKAANSKKVKMTPEQFTQFAKGQVEFGTLPMHLFRAGETFVNRLCEEKEKAVDEIFRQAFGDTKLYKGSRSDYDVMALDIAEDLTLIRVDMPESSVVPSLCYRMYLTFDPITKKACYFAIEKGREKNSRQLGQVTDEGKHIVHGEAPVEGAELQKIMDLARASESGLTS